MYSNSAIKTPLTRVKVFNLQSSNTQEQHCRCYCWLWTCFVDKVKLKLRNLNMISVQLLFCVLLLSILHH